ncbi:YjjG family noncanonical pyrimidine nucleotidase [Salinimicrobium sp. GXAS 041]|uniref:YjjG family noncanonical pyrimidine nucleotidase n=1 Tax=Salinimicrobium sp. GXAS 041 TaxID=3400806 RepID=UPI003C761DA5
MKLNNIEHIFFDLDHTLWDFDKNSGLAFNSIFQKNKIKVEIDRFMEVYAPINENYWKLYRQDKVSQQDLRYGRLRESFDSLEIDLTKEQIDILAIDYIDHLPQNNILLEGAVELLEYLAPRYKLHIITNGFREVQYKKLENSQIMPFFDTVTTSEDAGVKKPHRLIFEKALESAGAMVTSSLMIGDNFEADVVGAQKVGMRAILYNYYKKEFSPECLQVLKMKEIAAFL